MNLRNNGDAAFQGHLAWSERIQSSQLASEVVANLEGRAPEIWRRSTYCVKRARTYRNAVDDAFTVESKEPLRRAACHDCVDWGITREQLTKHRK
jgi:hypothetical protein